ncbi:AMP-binding protein [Streptomyces sp. AC555_RSS877]|uniref:AMP-binding protein n=1 Tax=Streptomyces sp. AC555_RSS877 TaxID=2823688 RepID=UPI0020B7568F|nr:AMP-binding protein [Streptomyces sp. AC555_RSS877]
MHVRLFTAFAPSAVALRLGASGAKAVVVDADQRGKLAPGEDMPADRSWLTVVAGGPESAELSFGELLARYSGPAPQGRPVATDPDAPLVPLFTSGTTGGPKGVPVPVRAPGGARPPPSTPARRTGPARGRPAQSGARGVVVVGWDRDAVVSGELGLPGVVGGSAQHEYGLQVKWYVADMSLACSR